MLIPRGDAIQERADLILSLCVLNVVYFNKEGMLIYFCCAIVLTLKYVNEPLIIGSMELCYLFDMVLVHPGKMSVKLSCPGLNQFAQRCMPIMRQIVYICTKSAVVPTCIINYLMKMSWLFG